MSGRFPPALALELFGFDYIDPRVQGGDDLLQRLGAQPITYADYVNVFRSHGDWLKKQSEDWKAELYAQLAELDPQILIRHGLANTPCVPIINGDFAVPATTSVFYPLSRKKKYGFESELTIVDSELLDKAAAHSSRVKDLFIALEVKTDEPYDLVTSHILPRHEGESWKTSEYKALLGHLRYIKDTGTPLLGRARQTNQWFGDYVSEYNFKQSMDDGATVPLFYQKRVPEVLIQNDSLSEDLAEICEDENLDDAQQAKLENKFAQEVEVIKRDDRLKDPEHPLQLVFVCAMWLTGFDAPTVSTLYLDKPMKDHTLMQTIARANRVTSWKINGVEKKNGEIIDYYNVLRTF